MAWGRHRTHRPRRATFRLLAPIVVIAASLAAGVAAFAEIHEPPGEDATPMARASLATPPSSPAEHIE
jgi:hypothetical protein